MGTAPFTTSYKGQKEFNFLVLIWVIKQNPQIIAIYTTKFSTDKWHFLSLKIKK